jgi:hypothetical protein
MTFTDYLIDSALVLLVLLQIKERPLTDRSLIRPLVITAIAVVSYFHGVPTAGNDLVFVGVLALTGLAIGVASGQTVIMRRDVHGVVLARAAWASAVFWVLGMGSRFAFLVWVHNGGGPDIARFSAEHSITGGAAWSAALLAMVICEVGGRALVQLVRRQRLLSAPALEPA